jgi:integrase/recombinase XerD
MCVSGIRVSEAQNLKLQDVDLKEAVLTIRGAKFGKDRLVPLRPSTCQVFARYLARRRRMWSKRPASNYLFVSNRGNRLDDGDIRRTFYALSRDIGLRGPTEHHGLDRTARSRVHFDRCADRLANLGDHCRHP